MACMRIAGPRSGLKRGQGGRPTAIPDRRRLTVARPFRAGPGSLEPDLRPPVRHGERRVDIDRDLLRHTGLVRPEGPRDQDVEKGGWRTPRGRSRVTMPASTMVPMARWLFMLAIVAAAVRTAPARLVLVASPCGLIRRLRRPPRRGWIRHGVRRRSAVGRSVPSAMTMRAAMITRTKPPMAVAVPQAVMVAGLGYENVQRTEDEGRDEQDRRDKVRGGMPGSSTCSGAGMRAPGPSGCRRARFRARLSDSRRPPAGIGRRRRRSAAAGTP